MLLKKIEDWIILTNQTYSEQKQSCSKFINEFDGFYSAAFLSNAYFVVVDEIPKPDFPDLRDNGLGGFLDMDVDGITYDNVYYIKRASAENMRLHFHELVHVAQWQILGITGFLDRYIKEINGVGYDRAPLERIAYAFDQHFSVTGTKIDVLEFIQANMG